MARVCGCAPDSRRHRRLARIQLGARAVRDPADVEVIAVTKTHGADVVAEYSGGARDS